MNHMKRKLTAVFAPLLAMFVLGAVMASPALAGKASESLPSTKSNKWTGVSVACTGGPPCTFKAVSNASFLTKNGAKVLSCVVTLIGTVNATGGTSVTSVVVAKGDEGCQLIEPKNLPWANQICQYTGSPIQYWDQLHVDFVAPGGIHPVGFVYIHLLNAMKANESPLTIAHGSVNGFIDETEYGIQANDAGGSEMYEFVEHPAITVTSTTASCPWNFANLNG